VSTLPGFNHAFGSLHKTEPPEMIKWFHKATSFNHLTLLFTAMFPLIIVCHLIVMEPTSLTYHQPTERTRAFARLHNCIRPIGLDVISQKKDEILSSSATDSKGGVEKKDIQGRDLLSLLIKANMATDIPEDARMTDEDILARKLSSTYICLDRNTELQQYLAKRFLLSY
jgi:hypothetical protein